MICNYNQFLDFVLMLSEQEIPKPAYNYRYTQVLSTLVRVVGLEPTRLAAQEPKGDVTLVKAGRRLCQWCIQEGAVRNPIFH